MIYSSLYLPFGTVAGIEPARNAIEFIVKECMEGNLDCLYAAAACAFST
jgi:hypothetical protein